VFVVSDAITFVALLGAAASMRGREVEWPAGAPSWALLGALTVLLFAASALLAAARRAPALLFAVAALGVAFVAGEAYEWRTLVREHLGPGADLRHACLFVITGLHAAHVLAGSLYAAIRRPKDTAVLQMYWAALDVAWVAIVLVVYR